MASCLGSSSVARSLVCRSATTCFPHRLVQAACLCQGKGRVGSGRQSKAGQRVLGVFNISSLHQLDVDRDTAAIACSPMEMTLATGRVTALVRQTEMERL